MWAHLRPAAASQARALDTPAATQDVPSPGITLPRGRRSIERSISSTNPRSRRRQRTAEARRCCQCTRFATCGADPRAVCECRAAARECYNCCAGGRCRNRPSEQIVATPPPGDNSFCRPAATVAPTRQTVSTAAAPSGSPADQDQVANEDPTIELPVAEEVPIESNTVAPTEPGTITGAADTPNTGISAFPDLSQEVDQGEIRESVEEVEDVEQVPEGGGTATSNDVAVPAEERAGRPESNLEDPEKMLDLANQQSTECDDKLISVYGDTTHRNDGRHLHGGVPDDTVWQRRYDRVVSLPHKLYFPPQGQVGKQVVATYAQELRGVRERKWNSERPLIFLACVLRRRPGCTRSKDIKR